MDLGILYHSLLSTTLSLCSPSSGKHFIMSPQQLHRNQSGPALLLHSGHCCWALYPLPMRAERLRPPLAGRAL